MASVPAPVLGQRQVARSLKAKASKLVKNTLCTPYKVLWPAVEGPTQDAIITELKKNFTEHNLRNPLSENSAYRRLRKDERSRKKDEYLAGSEQSPEDTLLRSQLVFGVSEITRRLEKGMLRLFIVDRSSPWQLHRHLAQLSVIRGCPALALDRMSDALSSFVSVTRMCALGFKVKSDGDSEDFDRVVDFIVSKCPPINLPWLDCENVLLTLKEEATENKHNEGRHLQRVGGPATTKSNDTITKEMTDYSYLYIKKSQMPNMKSRICVVENTVFDDVWGLDETKNRLQNSEVGIIPLDVAESEALTAEDQDSSKYVKKSRKSRKRVYSELNIEQTVKNSNKKNKRN